MKKRVISFVLLLAMLATVLPSVVVTAATTPEIKNVIYLIPDGGGYPLYDFADMVKQSGGFRSGLYPNRTPTDYNPMTMRSYLAGSMTTAPYGGGITDSAAAGTAMAAGQKTYNGRIGVDINGKPIANLVEAAQSVGKATGLVATYEWMHATPASFSAHAMDRNDYYNLYQQIENHDIDVILGAGYGAVSSYATIQNAVDRGYTVINRKTELADVEPGDKIWGNMGAPSMPYDINLVNSQPTLAEMTDAAITALSGDEDGFFLMVEGSKVDTGGHANDALVTTSEYLAFDAAFKVAVDFAASRTDTVVVCAPDHDTGGMLLKSTNIADMKTEIKSVCNGADPATMGWTSTNHTDQNVGVWMYVPEGVSVIDGLNSVLGDTASTRTDYLIDNTAIAPYVADLFGVDLAELSEELFVDVTSIGTYSGGKFTFNNGNKYVYANQSVYYKDGQEISMDGKVAVVLNNKVFVPAEMVEEADWGEVTEGYDGFTGSGTASDPYIIAEEEDFMEFTSTLLSGETYSGKYFKQTADLDMAGYPGYNGMGASATFAGTYDGNGNVINFAINTASDECVFPYVTGTLMNLGTTGSLVCTSNLYVSGIVRSLRPGGKVVNCYSTATINGRDVSGIVWSNYGEISNCYFAGSLIGTNVIYPIAQTSTSSTTGTYANCYYVSGCGATQSESGISEVSTSVATSTLAENLNNGRAAAATLAGVSESAIFQWTQQAGTLPGFGGAVVSTVTGVTVTPSEATVNKGDALQLTATVQGENDPSQQVLWSLEPESSYEGTYITEQGYLVIDPEETRETFTVLAKSVQNGSIGGISTITVGNEVVNTPDGSQARPYLIEDEEDFAAFTNAIIGGETYSGKYFKQTADLDMAGYPGYVGMGRNGTFAGIYDGNGHRINIDINTSGDECVFPYVSGIIMNLGTTGTLVCTGQQQSSGIVRSLRTGGKVVNCYSTVSLTGYDTSGVVWSNYGTISNCYFAGSLSSTNTRYPISQHMDGGAYENCYYVAGCGATQDHAGTYEISEAVATSTLADTLNNGRAAAAELVGVDTSKLVQWVQEEGTMPRFFGSAVSTVTSVTVTPDTATVNKGDALQLTATVEGENTPSQKVIWSLEPASSYAGTSITQDGYLTIDTEETAQTITVIATSAQDENVSGRSVITVGNEVVIRPDGSKERPYLIEDEADFLEFTNNVRGGNKYQGVYFKQTADLDMAGYPGYTGMGSSYTFSGIYDGDGHVINLAIETTGDNCAFPYTDGVIMNLGTTGSVINATFAAGLARSIRAGGKMINCWSSADVSANQIGGIAWTNYGIMVNCYYSGDQEFIETCHEMVSMMNGATTWNTFYLGEEYVQADDVTQITQAQLTGDLVTWLNEGREEAAEIAGYETDELVEWVAVENQGPRHKIVEVAASLEDVVYENGSVVGNIVFDLCLADCTAYVALYDADNALAAVQQLPISAGEDAEDFTLTYTLADNATYTVKLLLWDEVMSPLALPESTTVAK